MSREAGIEEYHILSTSPGDFLRAINLPLPRQVAFFNFRAKDTGEPPNNVQYDDVYATRAYERGFLPYTMDVIGYVESTLAPNRSYVNVSRLPLLPRKRINRTVAVAVAKAIMRGEGRAQRVKAYIPSLCINEFCEDFWGYLIESYELQEAVIVPAMLKGATAEPLKFTVKLNTRTQEYTAPAILFMGNGYSTTGSESLSATQAPQELHSGLTLKMTTEFAHSLAGATLRDRFDSLAY
ncbi:hypothetical protein M1563_05130 [Patescibacteria group bacterium]|nr:hypothetical protein [Patescibacteria group bacterium]